MVQIEKLLQRPFFKDEIAKLYEREKITGNDLVALLEKEEKSKYDLSDFYEKAKQDTASIEDFRLMNEAFSNGAIFASELLSIVEIQSVFDQQSLMQYLNKPTIDDMKKIRRIFGENKTPQLIMEDFSKKVLNKTLEKSFERTVEKNLYIDLDYIAHSLDVYIMVDEEDSVETLREIIKEFGKPLVFSIWNKKGGTGKTTTAVTVADLFAKYFKVDLIDSDEQANATGTRLYLGAKAKKHGRDYESYAEVLTGDAGYDDAILETGVNNLSILPAASEIEELQVELSSYPDKDYRLQSALYESESDHEIIVIDCPPASGTVVMNNLAASDYVIIPLEAQDFSVDGYNELIERVTEVAESGANPNLKILGYVTTRVATSVNYDKNIVRENYNFFVKDEGFFELGKTSNITDAKRLQEFQVPMYEYAPGMKVTEEYNLIFNQILRRTVELYKSEGGSL